MTNMDNKLREILDKHAEYYIKETMRFFQDTGKSPALSKNNKGDLQALSAITDLMIEIIGEDEPDTEDFDPVTNTTIFWSHEDSNRLRAELRSLIKGKK